MQQSDIHHQFDIWIKYRCILVKRCGFKLSSFFGWLLFTLEYLKNKQNKKTVVHEEETLMSLTPSARMLILLLLVLFIVNSPCLNLSLCPRRVNWVCCVWSPELGDAPLWRSSEPLWLGERRRKRRERKETKKKADEKRAIGEESGGEGANGETRKGEETRRERQRRASRMGKTKKGEGRRHDKKVGKRERWGNKDKRGHEGNKQSKE